MTGMGGGTLGARNAQVTTNFLSMLRWQLIVVILIAVGAAVLAALWLRRHPLPAGEAPEPVARRILRVGFGVLWLVDGLLQVQPSMPIGLPTQVVQPTVATAPSALSHLVTLGIDAWLRHPTVGAVATIWIQIGLGAWLLLAREGWLSRAAGWASAGWALAIWVLGAGLGGLFVSPVTWLFGAPGATFYYVFAGVLLGLPAAWIARKDVVTWLARAVGLVFVWLGVVQALPGSGFWSGGTAKDPGALASMAQQMAQLSQPRITASTERWFATASLHVSPVFNAVVVAVLLGVGVTLIVGWPRLLRPAAWAYGLLALVTWVVVQDFGVFGGVGTDVNSMIPSSLLVIAICVALTSKVGIEGDEPASPATDETTRRTRVAMASASIGVFAFGSIGMLILPLIPGASIDAALAAGSDVASLQGRAPNFSLTDQAGQRVSLASFRGSTVVLSFIDPVCTSDCPIEAQELKAASAQLGGSSKVAFVAINSNPTYRSTASLQAFDAQERMGQVPNWRFLTGSSSELRRVWDAYGVVVTSLGAGGMVSHAEPIFIIRPNGQLAATWAASLGEQSTSVLGRSTTALVVSQVRATS